MKKTHLPIIVVILVVSILLAAFAPIVPVAHKYPDPGTPEWSSVDTGEKLVGEVSAYHASRMTNWALLDTVADWPFLINVGAFGSLTTGVEAVAEQYPCVKELERRIHRNPAGMLTCMTAYVLWRNWIMDEDTTTNEKVQLLSLFETGVVLSAEMLGLDKNEKVIQGVLRQYHKLFPIT